jgi:hypothetical protein
MKLLITLILSFTVSVNLAQIRLSISTGVTHAKGRYGADWKQLFTVKPGFSWAIHSTLEMPVSKKIALHNTLAFTHNTFSYAVPSVPDFGFNRTESVAYIGIKPALHFFLYHRKRLAITAGAGLFASWATGGKYQEAGSTIAGPYVVKGNLNIGNKSGNSYKSTDAGFSLEATARYKNFILPVAAGFSVTNNIPGKNAAIRKWQSLYAGIGYVHAFKKKEQQ